MICDEYIGHKCLENYNDVHLDENYYFYPLLGKLFNNHVKILETL